MQPVIDLGVQAADFRALALDDLQARRAVRFALREVPAQILQLRGQEVALVHRGIQPGPEFGGALEVVIDPGVQAADFRALPLDDLQARGAVGFHALEVPLQIDELRRREIARVFRRVEFGKKLAGHPVQPGDLLVLGGRLPAQVRAFGGGGRQPGGEIVADFVEVEHRQRPPGGRGGGQQHLRPLRRRAFLQRTRTGHREKVVMGINRQLETHLPDPEFRTQALHRLFAEEIEMFLGFELSQEGMMLGAQRLVAPARRITGRLDQQKTARTPEEGDGAAQRCPGVGQMLQHVHQNHGVPRGGREILVLQRAFEHGHPEPGARLAHQPGAQFQANGIQPRPTLHRHKAAVSAAQFQGVSAGAGHVLQQGAQPVEAALRQVRAQPGFQIGIAVVFLEVAQVIVFAVQAVLVLAHMDDLLPAHLA